MGQSKHDAMGGGVEADVELVVELLTAVVALVVVVTVVAIPMLNRMLLVMFERSFIASSKYGLPNRDTL